MKYFCNLLFLSIFLSLFLGFWENTRAQIRITNPYISYVNSNNSATNDYSSVLNEVELYLFKRVYPNTSTYSRVSRIEKYLFKRNYISMPMPQRIDNILKCYEDPYYINRSGIQNFLTRTFIGIPTGITPPVPYYNNHSYGYNYPSYGINRVNYSNWNGIGNYSYNY